MHLHCNYPLIGALSFLGLGLLDTAIEALNSGLVHDPSSSTAAKDRDILNATRLKLLDLQQLIREKKFRVALPQIEKLIKDVGSGFRDLNLMRVECLLELKRTLEAYNVTNSMVRLRNILVQCNTVLTIVSHYFWCRFAWLRTET